MRLGHPLVNEVVIPLRDKDRFNAIKPPGDIAFLSYVTDPELPKLFNLLYGIPVPTTPRNDLVTVFLTGIPGLNQPANANQVPCEMLRLNMAIAPAAAPNRFGVIAGDIAGFPNGRRLIDDVVDIEERAAAGGYVLTPDFNAAPANQLGDGVDANDVPYLPYFPYAAPPHSPFDHDHHVEQKSPHAARGQSEGAPSRLGDGLRVAGPHPAATATLAYSLASPARVRLTMFDAAGREVRTLVDQDAAAGDFVARWDGRTSAGDAAGRGVYFARLTADGREMDTRKVVLE